VRVGRTNQDEKQIAENIEAALPQVLAYVTVHDKIKFSKLQNVSVKIGESPELPVFN
jgi:ribosomal protein L1